MTPEESCIQIDDGIEDDEGSLCVSDLTVRAGRRLLVEKACFRIPPGSLTMCSGLSGSGKSSLLKCLAGRLRATSGTATKDGVAFLELRAHERRRVVAYCSQDPVFCPGWQSMTVKEYLEYVARLQLPTESHASITDKIESLTEAFGLDASTAVLARRSGGELKRVSVLADACLSEASTVLLDEATSGLSHTDALRLMQVLKTDAIRHKKVMLATIHQPSIKLFELFSTVVLIHSGRIIYCGLRNHLKEGTLLNRILDTPNALSDTMATITMSQSETLFKANSESFRESLSSSMHPSRGIRQAAKLSLRTSFFHEFKEYILLTQHATRLLLTNGSATWAAFLFQALESALTGWVFSSPDEKSVASGFSRLYAASRTPTSTFMAIPPLVAWYVDCWRATSCHEIANGRYGAINSILALATATVIRSAVLAIPTMTLYYWLADLYVSAYGWTFAFEFSCILFQCILILSLAIRCGTVEKSFLLYSIFSSICGTLKGSIISERGMVSWAQKASFYSPLRWQFQGTASAQLGGRSYKCTSAEVNIYACPVSGNTILARSDLNNFNLWKLALLLPACITFSLIAICIWSSSALQQVKKVPKIEKFKVYPDEGTKSSMMDASPSEDKNMSTDTLIMKQSISSQDLTSVAMSIDRTICQEAATLCLDSFSVVVKESKKVVVDRVSLQAKPGAISAILGFSGSGKTCLIRGLASGLTFPAITTGKVTFKQNQIRLPVKQTDFALVSQHNCLSAFMSVEEHIRYAAALVGSDASEVLKLANSIGLKAQLMRSRCQHLSGGEARRVSLCVDGLARTDARVLLGDEITTGLSATDVLQLAMTLRRLVEIKTHLVILLAVHTPRRELLECFDTLILLRRGGKVACCGSRMDLQMQYADNGMNFNLAEVLLEKLEEDLDTMDEVPLFKAPSTLLDADDDKASSCIREVKYNPEQASFFVSRWRQMPVLVLRFVDHAARTPGLTVVPAVESVFIGMVLGLICFQIQTNSETARDIIGIFFSLTVTKFIISAVAWPAFLDLEHQIRHEVRLFKLDALAALLPFLLVNIVRTAIVRALLVLLPTYILAGLAFNWRAILYAYLAVLVACLSGFVLMFIAISITGSRERAASAISLLTLLSNLNGFQRPVNDLPFILKFFSKYANPLYFALDAAVTAQLPSTLDCPSVKDDATVSCPISKNEYLRTAYSYGVHSPSNRILHAFIVLAVLYSISIAIFARQLHLPQSNLSLS